MRIYNKIIVDIETGTVLESDWFEYDGAVALCDAAIYIGLALAAVSAAVGAGGAVYSADASRRTANYNADVMAQEALAAKDKAAYDEKMHREHVKKVLSTQRALYGDTGLSNEGTSLMVMEESVKQGEMDALVIKYGGDIAAAKARSQGNLFRMQGRQSQTAGYIGAGSTLLGGLSQAAGMYKPKAKVPQNKVE